MKVMIVDDHALVRRGMGYVVKECSPTRRSTRPAARTRRCE